MNAPLPKAVVGTLGGLSFGIAVVNTGLTRRGLQVSEQDQPVFRMWVAAQSGRTAPICAVPEELRLDIDASVQPDVVGTTTDMSAVADGSVDALFSSHNIEHLYPHEVALALAEFGASSNRGFVLITCPI